MPNKAIIDDDVLSIRSGVTFAVLAPDAEILGVSVVTGGGWRDACAAHALRLLELAGRTDIPVLPGAIHPLVNTEEATRRWETLHGKLVYKGAWMERPWPEGTLQSQVLYHAHDVVPPLPHGDPTFAAATETAAEFMVRTVRRYPGEVTIVAMGPMTNVALAQRLDPQFASLAKELVFMGGSLNPQRKRDSVAALQFAREFVHTPRLEFNFRFDPEAASIMLRAPWRKITMVPVDPSTDTEMSAPLLAEITCSGSPLACAMRDHSETGFPLWDEIAVAVWLDPSLVTESQRLSIDVDTAHSAGYGNTLSWEDGHGPGLGERSVTVVRAIDVPRFERWLVDTANAVR